MRYSVLLPTAALTVVANAAPLPCAAQALEASTYALRNVTVVDVRDGRRLPAQTVVISGEHIAAIGPVQSTQIPQGARVVDASGQFLIPGLVDTHAHLGFQWGGQPADTLAYFGWIVANGVTGVRDMSTGNVMYKTLVPLRSAIASGTVVGPRIYISAGAREKNALAELGVADPGEGMRRYRELGIDGVKIKVDAISVPAVTPVDSLLVMIRQARAAGMPAYGHTMVGNPGLGPNNFTMEAVQAGMESVSHVPIAYFPMHRAWEGEPPATPGDPVSLRERQLFRSRLWQRISDSATTALIDTMVRRGVSFEPTLTFYHAALHPEEYDWAALARYQTWQRTPQASTDSVLQRVLEEQYAAGERFVKRFAERGGMLIVGTDEPPLAPLGPASEIRLMVRAGVSPLVALQAATLNAAKAMHMADRLGTIEAGKLADLLLLDADPLTDVANVQKVRAVVANGRLLDRPALDQLLARVGTPVARR